VIITTKTLLAHQARAVANAKAEPLGIALSEVKQSQEWKLGVLASTTAPWQVELVMNEDREKVAWLIARLESRSMQKVVDSCYTALYHSSERE